MNDEILYNYTVLGEHTFDKQFPFQKLKSKGHMQHILELEGVSFQQQLIMPLNVRLESKRSPDQYQFKRRVLPLSTAQDSPEGGKRLTSL